MSDLGRSSCVLALIFALHLLPGCRGEVIPIIGLPHFYPTGVAHWGQANSLLVGGYNGGAVQKIELARYYEQQTWLPPYADGRTHVLRMRMDNANQRLWILDYDAVYIYAADTATLLTRIPLPILVSDRRHCLPDMVLDAKGDAYISENRVPKIYRVAASGSVSALDGILEQRMESPGFSAMALSPDGRFLLAGRSAGGDLWRIELSTGQHRLIDTAPPMDGVCALQIVRSTIGYRLVVARGFSNRVSVLDLSSDFSTVLATLESWSLYVDTPVSIEEIGDHLVFSSSRLAGHRDFHGNLMGGDLFHITKASLPPSPLDISPDWNP